MPFTLHNRSNRILIIDDDKSRNSFLSDLLRERGYEPAVSNSYENALERLNNSPYDVILFGFGGDHKLLEGLEVYLAERHKSPQIIFMFEKPEDPDQSKIFTAGNGRVTYCKSNQSGDLLTLIDDLLEQSQEQPSNRIVIVDDNLSAIELLHDYLSQLGYDIYCFTSGRDITHHLVRIEPFLIFLDIILPGYDGIEILEDIRRMNTITKIIMLTGVEDAEICQQSIKKGANDFICKPLSLDHLKLCVSKNLPGGK